MGFDFSFIVSFGAMGFFLMDLFNLRLTVILVGCGVGLRVDAVGEEVGVFVLGAFVGYNVVGASVGFIVGHPVVGMFVVGLSVGIAVVGFLEGLLVGESVGFGDGDKVGLSDLIGRFIVDKLEFDAAVLAGALRADMLPFNARGIEAPPPLVSDEFSWMGTKATFGFCLLIIACTVLG